MWRTERQIPISKNDNAESFPLPNQGPNYHKSGP